MIDGALAKYTVELRTGRRRDPLGEPERATTEIRRPRPVPDRTVELGDDDLVVVCPPPPPPPRATRPAVVSFPNDLIEYRGPGFDFGEPAVGGTGLKGLFRALLFRLGWLRIDDALGPDPSTPIWRG